MQIEATAGLSSPAPVVARFVLRGDEAFAADRGLAAEIGTGGLGGGQHTVRDRLRDDELGELRGRLVAQAVRQRREVEVRELLLAVAEQVRQATEQAEKGVALETV